MSKINPPITKEDIGVGFRRRNGALVHVSYFNEEEELAVVTLDGVTYDRDGSYLGDGATHHLDLVERIPNKESSEIERLKTLNTELLESSKAFIDAIDEFRAFEKENPNNSTKRWDEKFYAKERAEEALRKAIAKAEGKL